MGVVKGNVGENEARGNVSPSRAGKKGASILATTGVALALQAMLGGQAAAQGGAPDGFVDASSLSDVVDISVNSDGSATLTLSSGETVFVPASSVNVVDGVVFIEEAALSEASAASSSSLDWGLARALAIGGLGVGGAAVALAGGDDDNAPPPTPPPPNSPPVFVSADTVEVAENESSVITVSATDGDNFYGISGGADAALFEIDSATGALSFVAPPDFEQPGDADGDNVYALTVSASDGVNTTTQDIVVTVTNVSEGAPSITSPGDVFVAENSVAVQTVTATDEDGDAITYSISGGADAALFAIDATTGALTFISAPDAETPGDADGDNVYEVTVTASDGVDEASKALSVTVTNENDNAPVFTSDAAVVVEDGGTATTYQAAATDLDGDTISFSITGTDAALFSIDSASGVLTFNAASDVNTPLDDGADNTYDLTVTASDGVNEVTQAVAVTVVAQGVPIITSAASSSVAENNLATGYTVTATDTDTPVLAYGISGGADAALFAIDAATGALSFVAAPDFEAPGDAGGDNVYDVTVSASDGVNTTTKDVAISVTDASDVPPVFTSSAAVSVAENLTDTGYTAAATPDVDGAALTFSIGGGADASLFTIDGSTGELSFNDRPDFEAPGDDGADNVYNVTVTASDGTSSGDQDVTVTVTDTTEVFAILGAVNPDRAGYSVTSLGDVDGDGLDDVVVGAMLADGNGRDASGETYIVFGSKLAANSTGVLDLATASNIGVRIGGALVGDESGFSVASAGDVDGDGKQDLLIGAHNADPNMSDGAGSTFLIFGDTISENLGGSIDLGNLGDGGVEIRGVGAWDQASYSVASAGDVDKDGKDDVIIGAIFADSAGGGDAGLSYLVFGDALTEDADGVIELSDLSGGVGVRFDGVGAGDNSGHSVSSAGDVDGDGFDDVIIGARFADPAGTNDGGESYIVFGSSIAAAADGAVFDLGALGADGVRIGGVNDGDRAGWAVSSVGDIDGDGKDDVAIGAIFSDPVDTDPNANPGDVIENAGDTYIVFGADLAADVDGVLSLADIVGAGVRITGDLPGDESGYFVASAGDVDGDGVNDVLVGAHSADPGGDSAAGSTYVVFGAAILADEDGVIDLGADLGSAAVRIDGLDPDDQAGFAVSSAGDVDGDGLDDIIIGAPFADRDGGGGDGGEAYIISGALIAGEIGEDGIIDLGSSIGAV